MSVPYLDSWIWLEYVFEGPAESDAADVLAEATESGAATSTVTLAETAYILRRDAGRDTADYVTSSIEDTESIQLVPVSAEIALRAAGLRRKYYERRSCELSYADAIHIASALRCDCSAIHTGDGDFEDIDEIETICYR